MEARQVCRFPKFYDRDHDSSRFVKSTTSPVEVLLNPRLVDVSSCSVGQVGNQAWLTSCVPRLRPL